MLCRQGNYPVKPRKIKMAFEDDEEFELPDEDELKEDTDDPAMDEEHEELN